MVWNGRPLVRSSAYLPRLGGLRSSRNADRSSLPRRSLRTSAQQLRGGPAPGAAGAASPSTWLSSPLTLPAAAAALLAGGLALFNVNQQRSKTDAALTTPTPGALTASGWPAKVASDPEDAIKVLDAEALLASEHPFMEDDHMFSAFVARGIITDIEGFYSPSARKFSAVVALGREVAGFPRVVHGGLTAAIFDEAFGGLLFSLKKDGGVSTSWGPAYTVALEVAYKHKIPAGATVLCVAELESLDGRKMWFKARMSDGPEGKTYATARALFVTPKPHRMAWDVIKYLGRRVKEALPGGGGGGGGGGNGAQKA